MKRMEIKNQLDAFRDLPPQMPEHDSLGRTRQDIEKATKSMKREILDSIEFKNGKWFIEKIDADEWIVQNEETHRKLNHLD